MPADEELRALKNKLADIEEENAMLHQRRAEPKKLYASSQNQRSKISI